MIHSANRRCTIKTWKHRGWILVNIHREGTWKAGIFEGYIDSKGGDGTSEWGVCVCVRWLSFWELSTETQLQSNKTCLALPYFSMFPRSTSLSPNRLLPAGVMNNVLKQKPFLGSAWQRTADEQPIAPSVIKCSLRTKADHKAGSHPSTAFSLWSPVILAQLRLGWFSERLPRRPCCVENHYGAKHEGNLDFILAQKELWNYLKTSTILSGFQL